MRSASTSPQKTNKKPSRAKVVLTNSAYIGVEVQYSMQDLSQVSSFQTLRLTKTAKFEGLHLLTSSPPKKKTLCREFDDNPRSLSGSFRLLETLSFDQTDPVSFHIFSAEAGQVVFDIIGSTYTVAFTLELVLRIWGYGCRDFFCKEDWAWSILDVFVVATSLSELVLIILAAVNQNEGESLSGITSLKAFRIIRALFFM